ncbi:major facilitator superfamily domain-containing protein [Ilyonectria robusta]|uniref:major facilitator superfamily domain-containing protein n=1 Tax=Ilyonectria robusta TaxID=1079257 RepID=UPI001E8E9B12|nr:major facilitator superfamily domain-containing protein [Ilyonectria robusta]KAH8672205.1 major facilitator superfamily domain-containing protein [Ilyonectria robusta]
MPLGILPDQKLEHVPGTSPLTQLGREDQEVTPGVNTDILKHDPTGQFILVPQPSESPNDPYNWPRWKKEMFTVAIAYGCGCVGAVGPLLTSAFVPLAEEWGVSLSNFSLGCNGACIASIALGSLICNSLAVKIGKRPIYLVTSVGLFVSCFWAAEAKSFASLVAARAIQGFCMAPMEALVPASIADIWFIHERGYRTAIFNLGVLGGINLASPIAGPVIQYGSYRTCLLAMGGAFIIQFFMTLFFMPESAYHRSGALNIDTGDKAVVVEKEEKITAEHDEDQRSQNLEQEPQKTWMRELLPYDGYWHPVPFWKTLIRPFFMITSPIVLWATILFTTCISWLVLISISISQIFSAPPYNFSVSEVGATNVSPLVATFIGTVVAGPIIDGLVKYMSRMNHGTFEPEFRLPIMTAYLLFTATGFFAWGHSLDAQDPWPVPIIVCMGLINLGVQLGTTGLVAYVSDCHRQQAAEAFAVMNFIKNMFAFGMTFYANDWIATQGVKDCFFVIGGITVGVVLLTIPMYVFGKRARSFTHRHRLVTRIDE